MKTLIKKERETAELEKVLKGAWGTIGPEFSGLIDRLGKPFGVKYGLATFSNTAALEAVLRGLNIGYGDEVLVSDYSLPMDASVIVAVGATPVFCDIAENGLLPDRKSLTSRFTAKTKAVIMDLIAESNFNIKAISDFCIEKGLRLILNMGDAFRVEQEGQPIAKYADAAVLDLSEGTMWNVGYAGAVLTDRKELFDLFFSCHNCGRAFGEGCTLSFGDIIGGDLRIDEWQASLISLRLEQLGELSETEAGRGIEKSRCFVMHEQPFLKSAYYRTNTGSLREYDASEFPNLKKKGL